MNLLRIRPSLPVFPSFFLTDQLQEDLSQGPRPFFLPIRSIAMVTSPPGQSLLSIGTLELEGTVVLISKYGDQLQQVIV